MPLPLLASGYSPASLGVRARPSLSSQFSPRHGSPSFAVAQSAAATDNAQWLTHAIRLAHVGAIGSALAFPAVTNNAVGAVWRGYSSLALTRHPMFEACWAVRSSCWRSSSSSRSTCGGRACSATA